MEADAAQLELYPDRPVPALVYLLEVTLDGKPVAAAHTRNPAIADRFKEHLEGRGYAVSVRTCVRLEADYE